MEVEARHMNLFAPQTIPNRDFMKFNHGNNHMAPIFNAQMDSGLFFNEAMPESLLPVHQSLLFDPVLTKASMNTNNKDDSGLTYNVPPAPRKRQRDQQITDLDAFTVSQQKCKLSPQGGVSSFLEEDILFQIQQQQSEIDSLVARHTRKVMVELEERRKRQSRMLMAAIQEGILKKLKEKDEEIQRIGKLNWVLQERVKSLYVENQIWRDLAQTNEATANSLRSNLEQVLAHVSEDRHANGGATAAAAGVEDDAESSCGSNDDYGRRCTLAAAAEEVKDKAVVGVKDNNNSNIRLCKKCGERESSVLLLPCRHLCLCTSCGSNLRGTCPVCDSPMEASVHVNLC